MEIKEALYYLEQKYDQLRVHDAHKFLLKEYDVSGKKDGNWEKRCPACEKLFVKRVTTEEYSKPYIFYHAPYCTCGQKIDWEE